MTTPEMTADDLIDVGRLLRRVLSAENALTLALREIEQQGIRLDAQLSRILELEMTVQLAANNNHLANEGIPLLRSARSMQP